MFEEAVDVAVSIAALHDAVAIREQKPRGIRGWEEVRPR